MGEFAEESIERDWCHSLMCDDDNVDDVVNVTSEYKNIDVETLQKVLSSKDGFILRKRNGQYNIFATCIWQNEKSFLCRIEDYGERNDIGEKFFVPKSIVQYNKNEKLVLYVPDWARLHYSKK